MIKVQYLLVIITIAVLCILPSYSTSAFSFRDFWPFEKELKLTIYDFGDGSSPMVIQPDEKWEVGLTQGGDEIYFKNNWTDQMGNIIHWLDEDGYPYHRYDSEYEKETLWPPVVSIYTLTTLENSKKNNFFTRDSDVFRNLESRIDERIPDDYNGVFVEEETLNNYIP